MKRRRVVTIAVVLVGVPAVAAACLVLYLRFADLGGWRDTVAEKISANLGREVKFSGEFEPEIGLTTRLTAGDITLANPPWSDDPTMVSIRHLSIELELLSLVFGPLTIHDIEIEGARVVLEKDADGRPNWDFDTGKSPKAPSGPVELVLQHVLLENIQLTWREPSRSAPLNAGITHFETTEDGAGMLDLEFDGTIDDRNIGFSGRLGTLNGLLNAAAVSYDLAGTLDTVRFSSKGTIKELVTLAGVDVTADVYGDDLGDLRGLIYLPPENTGPFRISAAASPAAAGVDVHLDATVAGITATVDGAVDSLVRPKIVDAAVTASGPSIRTVGALTGVADLPDVGFSVSGGVRWEGFPVTIKQLEITVGDSTLSADGVLGAPPEMTGSDFSLHGQGPDLSAVGALAGIGLPRESYSVKGRVVRVEEGLEVQDFELRVGSTLVTVDGIVGEPPSHTGTTVQIHAEGPDLAQFNRLIGAELPAQPFVIDGRLAKGEQAFTLEDVNAHIGDTDLRVDGSLRTGKGLTGTRLHIDAKGADATQLRALVGLGDLPAEAWSAVGSLELLDTGLYLNEVSASVGTLRARADGRMGTSRGLVGTDLQLHAEDPDLAHAMPIFGVQGFPEVPIRAEGRLRVEDSGIRLDGVTGTAGDVEVAVDGLIGAPDLDGSIGHVSVRGPRMSSLGTYFHQSDFPAAPFSVEGNLHIINGAFNLGGVVVTVDDNRATINGVLYPDKGLIGTDVQVELTAPDLGRAGRLATTLVKLPDLPAEPMTLTTSLSVDEAGYEIEELRATLGEAAAKIDGRIGAAPDLVGTNLSVTADGPNASLFSALTGVTVPVAPFKISGRLQRTEDALLFDRVAADVGGHTVRLHGSLGERPRLVGTNLDFVASGPGTALVAELTGIHKLPDQPFRMAGQLEGTPEKFTVTSLEITLGKSDLKGSLEVDIRGKHQVTAKVSSNHIEFGELAPRPPGQDDEAPASQPATHSSKDGLVFSEKPFDFGWLERADGDVDITLGTLQMPVDRFHDFELQARLIDGKLDIYRIAMIDSDGGYGSGNLVLEPVGDGYRANLNLDLNGVRFNPPGEDSSDAAIGPPIDFEVHIQTQGKSPHGFAGSSNGSIQIIAGRGVMDNRVFDLISADILLTLLNAFNPFAKENVATELECAVMLVTFDQGVATLEPMALQSNRMTMLGHGQIDLGTEKLDLDWVTKPRKGIGISASMITNPYIKLGGTLSKPAIELKPMQAIASTGAAVATLGITWVAKGMLDRASADKKVCEKALEEIGRGADTSSKKSKKKDKGPGPYAGPLM